MMTMPLFSEFFILVSFSLYSLYDMRNRLLPGIEIFFIGCLVITLPSEPFKAAIVALAVLWGMGKLPMFATWPLLFAPEAWAVMLNGIGVRQNVVGRGDMLAVAGLACLFPAPAMVLAMFGVEFWRRWWVKRKMGGPVPALPGMAMGLAAYLIGLFILSIAGVR